jgi:hypothetical protein
MSMLYRNIVSNVTKCNLCVYCISLVDKRFIDNRILFELVNIFVFYLNWSTALIVGMDENGRNGLRMDGMDFEWMHWMRMDGMNFSTFIGFTCLCIALILVIACEIFRYFRLYVASSHLRPSVIKFPLCSFAIFGERASISRKIYATKDSAIFHFRSKFASIYQGVYISYHWSWKSFVDWSPKSISPLQLIVTDATIANLILQDTDTWVKPKVGPPVNAIIGLSCTQARGKDAIRQRRVLASALRSPKEFEGYITEASKKLVATVAALFNEENAPKTMCIDLQPLLHQLSLDINVWTLFGRETVGIVDFSKRFALFDVRPILFLSGKFIQEIVPVSLLASLRFEF